MHSDATEDWDHHTVVSTTWTMFMTWNFSWNFNQFNSYNNIKNDPIHVHPKLDCSLWKMPYLSYFVP